MKTGEREDKGVLCNHKKEEVKGLGLYTFLFRFSVFFQFVFIQQSRLSVFSINKKKEKNVETGFDRKTVEKAVKPT